MYRMMCLLTLTMIPATSITAAEEKPKKTPPALEFRMKTLDGKDVDLEKYRGKVILFVNVASKCGNTPQYEQLQSLHERASPAMW